MKPVHQEITHTPLNVELPVTFPLKHLPVFEYKTTPRELDTFKVLIKYGVIHRESSMFTQIAELPLNLTIESEFGIKLVGVVNPESANQLLTS